MCWDICHVEFFNGRLSSTYKSLATRNLPLPSSTTTKKYQASVWGRSFICSDNEDQISATRTLLQAKLQAHALKKGNKSQGRQILAPSQVNCTIQQVFLKRLFSVLFLKGIVSLQLSFAMFIVIYTYVRKIREVKKINGTYFPHCSLVVQFTVHVFLVVWHETYLKRRMCFVDKLRPR